MSQLSNASRSTKTSLTSPITQSKSLPTSNHSLVSVTKIKPSNRRSSTSVAENSNLGNSSRLSSSKLTAEQRSKARDIVLGLQRKNIKLVAVDFDNTFLSIHTGGFYQGTPDSLLEHIRSTFFYLIQEILDSPAFNQTLHLCIVSFSSQDYLIKKLLRLAFKTSKVDRIIIRCNTPEFVANMDEDFLGKEYHLSSVLTEIATRRHKTIKGHEILLLDDDVQNILIAEEFGHKALEIRDEINLDILKEFVETLLPDN